ncbi:tail assembly protein, partial [Klebsiella pneumoniae]
VFMVEKYIGLDDVGFHINGEVIRIVPVVIGSKKAGFLQTILGAVIVAVGAIATIGFGQAWGVNVLMGGGAMMLGGVV